MMARMGSTRRQVKPRAKPGHVLHNDPQQCDPRTHGAPVDGWHYHPVCKCDPDVDDGNVRRHIRDALDGHWPLADHQDVVTCDRCGGGVARTTKHKAALHYAPLES